MNFQGLRYAAVLLIGIGLFPLTMASSLSVAINNIRVSHNTSKTRLVFDFTGAVPQYKAFLLDNPERVVLDLPNVTFNKKLPTSLLKHSLVDDFRVGNKKNELRIVLDLLHDARIQTFTKAVAVEADNS